MKVTGQGGNWQVRELGDREHVFRVPLYLSEIKIKKFIQNHKLVKALGLPTLQKVEIQEISGEIGLICEDLNVSGGKIYVTHNSLYSDSSKDQDEVLENLGGMTRKKRPPSVAEQFRYEYKLDELIGFEDFIKSVKSDLEFATGKNVVVYYDAYFFGSLKYSTRSSIDYIIADLDDIGKFTAKRRNEISKQNYSEFNRAMDGFLRYFVTPGNRNEYQHILNDHIPA